jgi:hypothetical protein
MGQSRSLQQRRSEAARLCSRQAGSGKPAAQQRLAQHAKQHSRAHMLTMRKLMRRGHSFDEAHARAMETVGQ